MPKHLLKAGLAVSVGMFAAGLFSTGAYAQAVTPTPQTQNNRAETPQSQATQSQNRMPVIRSQDGGNLVSEGPIALVPSGNRTMADPPEVIVYEHDNFHGWAFRTLLNYAYVGDYYNDKISSIIVIRGVWRFCKGANFEDCPLTLGPGYYPYVGDDMNDKISSFCSVPSDPAACR